MPMSDCAIDLAKDVFLVMFTVLDFDSAEDVGWEQKKLKKDVFNI